MTGYHRLFAAMCCLTLVSACGTASSTNEEKAPAQKYAMEGTVVRLQDGRTRIAVIKHEEIKGWMEPMTMEFPVPDEDEFRKLKVGQRIAATVLVEGLNYWLEDIRTQQPH